MPFIHSDSSAVDVSASAPQATNWINMLQKLVAFVTNTSVATVAVNNGGTLYSVGDIVELNGGTHPADLATTRATFEVTAESAGVVTALRLRDAGSYTVNPATTGVATTALSGGGDDALTVNLTYNTAPWTLNRRTQEIDTAVVGAAGGTGYTTGDDIETIGGDTRVGFDTQTNTPGTFNVDTVSAGAITAISILTRGVYHRNAGVDEVPTAVITGGGDGLATVDLTYRDIADTATDIEVWMTGAATGAPVVGLRSFSNGTSVFNWELASAPVYTAANDWDAQVNMSPGRYPLDQPGSYCVQRDVPFNYYLNVTDRRIIAVFNIDNAVYTNIYIGFLDPYATGTEYDYPMLVAGCSSRHNFTVSTTSFAFAGMNCAIAEVATDAGPDHVFTPGGSWVSFHNGFRSGSTILGEDAEFHLIPGGNFLTQNTLIDLSDRITFNVTGNSQKQDWGSFASVATATGGSGEDAPTERFRPTPQTGGGDDQSYLAEIVCMGIEPVNLIAGEMSDVKQVDRELNSGVLNAEDIFEVSGELYVVFNNCKLTDRQHWFALKVSP